MLIHLLIHLFESCKNLRDSPVEEESGSFIAIETTASEVEEFLVRDAVDGECVTRFDVVGVDDECRNPADFPAGTEEDMSFLESPDDLFRPFFDIYRTVEQHFTERIRKREDMNLACRMVSLKRTFYNRLNLSVFLCMKSALNS